MMWMSQTWLRIKALVKRRQLDRDLEEELNFHLAVREEKLTAGGEGAEEARYAARRRFGSQTQVKEVMREMWTFASFEILFQDMRYGWRLLVKSPGFMAVAILTLALGIGANTAIFSVVHAVLLRGLPYPHSDRLAIIWSGWGNELRGPASGPEVAEVRQRAHLFEEIGGIWVTGATIAGYTETEQVRAGQVTANFLTLLADKPALGRLFAPEDERVGGLPVVILADGLWRRQFGADPAIIGKPVRIGGGNPTVVGVMPQDFRLIFPDDSSVPPDVQLFTPIRGELAKQSRAQGYIRMIGRLRKGVTFAQAQSEADGIAAALRQGFKDFSDQNLRLAVFPLHEDDVRNVRPALLALFGGVGLVLLIACANVANLLLARASGRHRETALRAALGAPRHRILRQLITESVLLGALGGVVAIGVGWLALKGLLSLWPAAVSRIGTIGLDGSVLGFTLALSLLTGILFGLAPAFGAIHPNLVGILKEGGRAATPSRRYGRSVLVAGEVALGLMLLVGTGLMIRTFAKVLKIEPGFQPANALTFQVSLPGSLFRAGTASQFIHDLEAKIGAMPGVQSVGMISHLPLDEGLPNWYSYYWRDGATLQEQNTVMADQRSTSPGYLKSVGATLIAGRDFMDQDDTAHAHVVIVDDLLAEQTWPGESAVGKKLSVEDSPAGPFAFAREWVEVVGVVRHIQYHSLTKNVRPQIYFPFPLAPRPQISFVVRASVPLDSLVAPIRQEIAGMDKQIPISRVLPLAGYVQAARAGTRFVTLLSMALAGVALLLACIGIYGITSYGVAQRTSEIGVRMALGAQGRDVVRMILREGIGLTLIGVAAGMPGAFWLSHTIEGLLFGVSPADPTTYAGAALLLLSAGVLACYVPARRATRVDPMVALRYE